MNETIWFSMAFLNRIMWRKRESAFLGYRYSMIARN